MSLVKRTIRNGVTVKAWTFDEFYGRDHKLLDGLQSLEQSFVGEVPPNFHGWTSKPKVRRIPEKKSGKRGPKFKKRYRIVQARPSCEVQNLATYSSILRDRKWQRYRIKDTNKGPEVWEVKWCPFWRKSDEKLPSKKQCLIVARQVETGEIKYFVSNMVPGVNGATLRGILSIAFHRSTVEGCFRTAKEELGMDHFEVRGYRCVHRHWYATHLSQLFCARVRQEFDPDPSSDFNEVTVEQIRSAINVWLSTVDLSKRKRFQKYQDELDRQTYYQKRNATARKSHTKTTRARLARLGIDADSIKSCKPKTDTP